MWRGWCGQNDKVDADSLGGEDWGVGGDYFVLTTRWVVLLGFNSTIVRIHRLNICGENVLFLMPEDMPDRSVLLRCAVRKGPYLVSYLMLLCRICGVQAVCSYCFCGDIMRE